MGFLFLAMAFLSANSVYADFSTVEKYGRTGEWTGLLQYQKNFLGFERSEVDGASFFLSPKGAVDPVAELNATLTAFSAPIRTDKKGEDNEHAICRFPARYEVLSKYFDFSSFPKPKCQSLHVYLERIQNLKVSVVFSSYYAGSASSVFGHSFLKFSGLNENELFDTGMNFAANPTTSNPILYSLYGLVGVFPSTFSVQPFYYKVREYSNFESRDLWSYDLNLSAPERELLISHLWELGSTYFDYFYLNENCSYQILRAIEGAVPRIRFFSRRPIYLIPSESIKLLYQVPGLVGAIHYRPSVRNVAFHGYDQLKRDQKTELLSNLNDHSKISNSAEVVDVLIDSVDLNEADKIAKSDPHITEWKERILKKRSELQRATPLGSPPTPEDEKPSVGHGTRRMTLGLEERSFAHDSRNSLVFRARASHHDLLDPSVGYPKHLHIDFGRVGFRYLLDRHNLILEDLTVVDLTALSLEHPLYSRWSYAVKLGFSRKWSLECSQAEDCPLFSVKAGFGKTYPLFQKHTIFALLNFEPTYSSGYSQSKLRLGVQPAVHFLFEWKKNFKTELKAQSTYTLSVADAWLHEINLENRYVWSDQWGIDFEISAQKQANQTASKLGLHGLYYF